MAVVKPGAQVMGRSRRRDTEAAVYAPVAPDALDEPYLESREDDVVRPGARAFASPGEPDVLGGEDHSASAADPLPHRAG